MKWFLIFLGSVAMAHQNWIEADLKNYIGTYFTEFENVHAEIEIKDQKGSLEAIFRVRKKDEKLFLAESPLPGFKFKKNHIVSNPIVVKSPWPLYLPQKYSGKFIKPKGIIFDKKIYQKINEN